MSVSKKNYTRLLNSHNKKAEHEKLLLGYSHSVKEITFAKDNYTYFHIPYFTEPVLIHDTSLIADGAVGASFPAAADRVYQNRSNYGDTTYYGQPEIAIPDGTWMCSWLYKDPLGNRRWMDRFYNPGVLRTEIIVDDILLSPYIPYNPVFRDMPSRLYFEPSVLYKYFHVGERLASDIITTISGLSGERLQIDLSGWGSETIDLKGSNVVIDSDATDDILYTDNSNSHQVNIPSINFPLRFPTEVSIPYDLKHFSSNEFGVSFWAKSESWANTMSTQLFGNYVPDGGFGLFVESLSSFPFFVLTENTYGHLLFVNSEGKGYRDTSIQTTSIRTTSARAVCRNFENQMFFYDSARGAVVKVDHTGRILSISDTIALPIGTSIIDIVFEKNDAITLVTSIGLYTFSVTENLKLQRFQPDSISPQAVVCVAVDVVNNDYDLVIREDVDALTCAGKTMWYSVSGLIYKQEYFDVTAQPQKIFDVGANVDAIEVGPDGMLWVLAQPNIWLKYDPSSLPDSPPVASGLIGNETNASSKNLGFLITVDPVSFERKWVAVIHYNNDSAIYMVNLDGTLFTATNKSELIDPVLTSSLGQDLSRFDYVFAGDFTGYRHRRTFALLAPFNNRPQLSLRAFVRDRTDASSIILVEFKSFAPLPEWDDDSWHHFVINYKNTEFSLFVDGKRMIHLPIDARYFLSFESYPTLYLGTFGGTLRSYNDETNQRHHIFVGSIGNVKVYNKAVPETHLELFIKEVVRGRDLTWTMPTPPTQYVEQIDRMFKHKIPGKKSQFYRIKVSGFSVSDAETRKLIEEQIRNVAAEYHPINAELLNIEWV